MRKLPIYFLLFTLLLSSCTGRGCQACKRAIDRRTSEANYEIFYYGLMGDQLRHSDSFRGYLHNDEGIDVWYVNRGKTA